MAKDDWITTAEAVTLSGYHVDHLRELAREGKIKAQKWGREWQISRASLRGPKTKA
jgi:excisionase family DNA binding protein